MPTYDYRCNNCKGEFEIFHSIKEIRKKCPRCGEPRLTKLIGPGSGFLFRGSGFYITDYRSSDYLSKSKAESETSKSKASEKPSSEEKPSRKAPAKEKVAKES